MKNRCLVSYYLTFTLFLAACVVPSATEISPRPPLPPDAVPQQASAQEIEEKVAKENEIVQEEAELAADTTATSTISPEQTALLASLNSQGPAPELNNELWLNSEPLKLADLRGKVVIVEFWTYG